MADEESPAPEPAAPSSDGHPSDPAAADPAAADPTTRDARAIREAYESFGRRVEPPAPDALDQRDAQDQSDEPAPSPNGRWTSYLDSTASRPAHPAAPSSPVSPAPAPASPPPPATGGPGRRRGAPRRRALVVVLLLAAVVVAYAVSRVTSGNETDASEPAAGRSAAPSAGATPAGATPSAAATPAVAPQLTGRDFQRGHCYTWDGVTPDVSDVPCDRPHRFEAISDEPVLLAGDYPPGAPYPSQEEWAALIQRSCAGAAQTYLGYAIDPNGRFSAAATGPTEATWQSGDRDLWCILRADVPLVGETGRWTAFDLFSGAVKGADQSWVYPVGACLAVATGGVVDCAGPHELAAIGDTRMADTADGAVPTEDAFNKEAGERCLAVAHARFGPNFQETATVRLTWSALVPDSWSAGSRTITCLLVYTTAAGEPSPVTGDQLPPG
ncbi:septum formation family protein [Pseudofrankia saprophytica]|uniref:septum formation family protein n=1 Tax=Pseudofrankia saprophytica TaxID=298655 RepID=UPI000234D8FA|nr:septum formation family protein [Pseudofrankia saprophytica]